MATKPPTPDQHAHANRITHRDAGGKFKSPPPGKEKRAAGFIAPKDPPASRQSGSSRRSILDTPPQDIVDELDEQSVFIQNPDIPGADEGV